MKITEFKIRNFRTLEEVDITFPSSYTAICGRNDSGKTNIVRAIRALMKEETAIRFFLNVETQEELSLKDDFPKWKDVPVKEQHIILEIALSVNQKSDTGLFEFLARQLGVTELGDNLELGLCATYGGERSDPNVTVDCQGLHYDGIQAQEVLKRLQSSHSVLFHNSTQADYAFPFQSSTRGLLGSETSEHEKVINNMTKTVNTGLKKISRTHQKEIESLLGRLDKKYRVVLSVPPYNFTSVPFSITLGERKFEVPLDEWGSGTRNRTLILLTLFRAKQLSESEASASKITPIIVIEEPESFLHPAAQAEFGRVLQDLAEEFEVQVIITTHSPYLLNMKRVESNVLLKRQTVRHQVRGTESSNTGGDNWAEPFVCLWG